MTAIDTTRTTIPGHRLRQAARVLRAGGVIAHPTHGVWGLACDAYNLAAVAAILGLKRRAVARGLIVIAATSQQLGVLVDPRAVTAWQRALQSWPGHTTWLLPARDDAPEWLTGDHATIALRLPAHADSAALCRAFGGPLVSTSANITGRAPVRSPWQARARFGAALDFVAGGQPHDPGRPSTIRDASSHRVLR